MAVYELKNAAVAVRIYSMGAELKSLVDRKTGVEYMWKADPQFWGRTSPVLFPFVGGLVDRKYRTKGNTYAMGQHGFARDMEFELLSKDEDEIWFVLASNEETRKNYPYDFVLKLGYRLLERGVEVRWQVENPMEEELPFSIGGHPAFNCPIEEGKKQTDYLLKLDEKETVVSTRISENGLAMEEKDTYTLEKGLLPITEHLFDQDALVIENNQVKTVSLCRENGEAYLSLTMEAPLFGIWSPPKKNAPFVCIEPWYGRCDGEGFAGELKDRKWENVIGAGEVWKAAYQIRI